MSALYRVHNAFGSGHVDEAEARRVFDTWADGEHQHIEGTLEHGFTAWVDNAMGRHLMGTRYEPITETS